MPKIASDREKLMIARILLAIDRAPLQRQLTQELSRNDMLVESIRGKNKLWERVSRETCDLLLISQSLLPRPATGTIQTLQNMPDAPSLMVLTNRDDPEQRAQFMSAGAEAVLFAGLPVEALKDVVITLMEKRRERKHQQLSATTGMGPPRLSDFGSQSPTMQAFMDTVDRVASSDTSLLLLGETGVGKERLARAIHASGARAEGPFIAINCGALPESLLESELFGHEEGSFTGATRSRRGAFELAHRGTVFLDEIGEMPFHLQVRLLRVLQEHEVQRVGGERPILVDVRVMAATNRDLEDLVENRQFRRDLYYRLSVVALTIPPLRQRQEDIAGLIRSYMASLRPRVGRDVVSISAQAIEALTRYDWPGNVRELINVLERAMLLARGDSISLADLPESISAIAFPHARKGPDLQGLPEAWLELSMKEARKLVIDRFEAVYLAGVLRQHGGRIDRSARQAGITPRALHGKMKRLGLRKEDFKPDPKSQGG